MTRSYVYVCHDSLICVWQDSFICVTRSLLSKPCLGKCVAVCCSVLQCVAMCCSVLQCDMTHSYVWHDLSYPKQCLGKCVAVCCSVLQCVAVCCSVLQCVAVWHDSFICVTRSLCCCVTWLIHTCDTISPIQTIPRKVCCSVLQCVAVCCSVLQCVAGVAVWHDSFICVTWSLLSKQCPGKWTCVAVCCIVLQCVAVCCSMLQCDMTHPYVWHDLSYPYNT